MLRRGGFRWRLLRGNAAHVNSPLHAFILIDLRYPVKNDGPGPIEPRGPDAVLCLRLKPGLGPDAVALSLGAVRRDRQPARLPPRIPALTFRYAWGNAKGERDRLGTTVSDAWRWHLPANATDSTFGRGTARARAGTKRRDGGAPAWCILKSIRLAPTRDASCPAASTLVCAYRRLVRRFSPSSITAFVLTVGSPIGTQQRYDGFG
jgi:hypothetical protein